jgi:hypothetical protein
MKKFPIDDQSEGCQIGDEKVEVGDHVDFPNLCVRLTCKADSAVEPTSIPVFLIFKLTGGHLIEFHLIKSVDQKFLII